MDARFKMGGQPFDNMNTYYRGSLDDAALNSPGGVERFPASSTALQYIDANLQTSGRLKAQLVTLHTTGDPIVPYRHSTLYLMKVFRSGSFWNYSHIPVKRYGHCAFKAPEALVAFAVMYLKANFRPLWNAQEALTNPADQAEYLRLAQEFGALQENNLFLPSVIK